MKSTFNIINGTIQLEKYPDYALCVQDEDSGTVVAERFDIDQNHRFVFSFNLVNP